jgi:hypothetical protein
MHATTSSATAIDPMDNPNAFILPLPPLLHYQHVPYRMNRDNKSRYEPIFAWFVYPHKAEPKNKIASETGVPLRTLYNWRRYYYIDARWRPGSPSSGSRKIFTDDQEKKISNLIRNRYLARHLPLTINNLGALILK